MKRNFIHWRTIFCREKIRNYTASLLFMLVSTGLVKAQCTTALVNWDAHYFRVNPPSGTAFAVGTNSMQLGYATTTLAGINATNTAEISSFGTGADLSFTGNGTVTLTFKSEVQNVKFSLYDIDASQKATISATNAAAAAQTVTLTKISGSVLTVVSGTSATATANSTSVGNGSTDGTVNVNITGPVKTITIVLSATAGDYWISDVNACVASDFPTNYYAVSTPEAGQPDYMLVSYNNGIFYAVNKATGAATLLFTDPLLPTGVPNPGGNSLAYDPYKQQVYYTADEYSTANKSVFRYDLRTCTRTVLIPDVTALGIQLESSGVGGAGGAFYGGSYYIGIDEKPGNNNDEAVAFWRIDFDASGNPINPASRVWGVQGVSNGAGGSGNTSVLYDIADFVINNGVFYNYNIGASSVLNTRLQHLSLNRDSIIANYSAVGRGAGIDYNGNVYTLTSAATGIRLYDGAGNFGPTTAIAAVAGTPTSTDASESFKFLTDFGDAPVSYGTAFSSAICGTPVLRIGAALDYEVNDSNVVFADGDDNYNTGAADDEDGLASIPSLFSTAASYSLMVSVLNTSGAAKTLQGWIDFNGNGTFDNTEYATVSVPNNASQQNVTLTWSGLSGLVAGTSYIRLRLNDFATKTNTDDIGLFGIGEVEDYKFDITAAFSIAGNVFNDANGLTDNTVNGTGTNATGLNAVLIDAVTGNVVAVATVAANGTYSFPGVVTGNYNVEITTNTAMVGASAPGVVLPTGWVSTGENLGAAAGNDGTANGILPLGVVSAGTSSANFGIEQPPTANNVSGTFTNPGGTATVQVPILNGTDPEQGTFPGTGNVDTVIINTLPASGTLYYNGVAVTAGQQINNYDPTKLTYDPPAGGGTYTFTYSEVDAALKSSAPATVSMTFNQVSITGNLYDDANGLNDGIINGTGTNVSSSLNAVLVDATTGLVVATTPVSAGGSYSFANLDGGKYNLEITTNTATVGTAAPAVALPSGWIATGENLGAAAGNDGTVNSILSLGTVSANVTNANFGIEQLPNSDNKTVTIAQPAPNSFITLNGGSNPPFFTGSDPEDQATSGTLLNQSVQISTLPTNGQLWFAGIQITSAGTILSGFDPSLLEVKFTGSGYKTLSFSYAYVDAAGIADPTPASYTLSWLYALPVKLVSFDAKAEGCNAILNWTTANERDMNRFVVERSTDGSSYGAIGSTPAKNAATGSSYNATYTQDNGTAFYRLKMEDKDGSYTYSNVVTVKINCTEVKQIKLWPNPATEQITLEGLEAGGQVMILNSTGQHIKTVRVTGTTQRIDLSGIPAGMYQVRVQDASGNGAALKFVKQ